VNYSGVVKVGDQFLMPDGLTVTVTKVMGRGLNRQAKLDPPLSRNGWTKVRWLKVHHLGRRRKS
jgi:hypothetical protein